MTQAIANQVQVPTLADRLASAIADMRMRGIEYQRCVREIKRLYLIEVLKGNRGNICRAAREIGMHRNSMLRMCDELHIDAMQIRLAAKVEKKRPQSTAAERAQRGAFA
jgi:Fis family transcriptional regulator